MKEEPQMKPLVPLQLKPGKTQKTSFVNNNLCKDNKPSTKFIAIKNSNHKFGQ